MSARERGARDRASAAFAGLELWLVDLHTAGAALETLEDVEPRLSREDERRFAAIGDEGERREKRQAHIALRLLIERAFGVALRGVPYSLSARGKPALPAANGSFSLSHASGFALIGFSREGPIGVDLEKARQVRLGDLRGERLARAAVALANGVPLPELAPARMLQAWVRLEAAAKAEGCGIGALLMRLRLANRSHDTSRSTTEPLCVHDLALGEDVFAAVALRHGVQPPQVQELPRALDGLRAIGR